MAAPGAASQHFEDILAPASGSPGPVSEPLNTSRPLIRSSAHGVVAEPASLHRRIQLPLRLGASPFRGSRKLRKQRAIANLRAWFIAHRLAVFSRSGAAELSARKAVQSHSVLPQVSTALGRLVPLHNDSGSQRPPGSADRALPDPLHSHRAGLTRPAGEVLRERRKVRVLRSFTHPKHRRYVRRWHDMSVLPVLEEWSAGARHETEGTHPVAYREQAGDVRRSIQEGFMETDRKSLTGQHHQSVSTPKVAMSQRATDVDQLQQLQRANDAVEPKARVDHAVRRSSSPESREDFSLAALHVKLARQGKIIEHYERIEALARQRADRLAADNYLLKVRIEESEAVGRGLGARAEMAEERAARLARHLFQDRRVGQSP